MVEFFSSQCSFLKFSQTTPNFHIHFSGTDISFSLFVCFLSFFFKVFSTFIYDQHNSVGDIEPVVHSLQAQRPDTAADMPAAYEASWARRPVEGLAWVLVVPAWPLSNSLVGTRAYTIANRVKDRKRGYFEVAVSCWELQALRLSTEVRGTGRGARHHSSS